jgi:tetratricopeptide (TPR) repeat protein
MRRVWHSKSVLAAVVTVLVGGPQVPLAAQDDWAKYRISDLHVLGDENADDMVRVAVHLEAFNGAFEQFFRNLGIRRLPELRGLVLDGEGDLRRAGLDDDPPYFATGPAGAFAVLTDADDDEDIENLLHQYFHAVARVKIPNAPLWVMEGLALVYQTTRWTPDGVVTAAPIDAYIRQVRDQDLRPDAARLGEITEISPLYDEDARASSFYAESWALMHYLITRDGGQGHDRTADLVARMAGGESFEEAASTAFGVGFRELLSGYQQQVRERSAWPRLTLSLDVGPADVAGPEAVPEVDAATTVGELLFAHGLRLEAEQQFGRAIGVDGRSARPRIGMAPLLIASGRYDEARFSLDRIIGGPDADPMAHFYYALSIILENEDESAVPSRLDVSRIRRELRAAIDLDPQFGDAYHRLAESFLGTGEGLEEAAQLLETALELRPETPDYLITFSRILIDQGRFDDARDVLLPLVDDTRDDSTRDRAVAIMQSIEGLTGGGGLTGDGFAEIIGTGRDVRAPSTPARPAPSPPAPPTGAASAVRLTRVVDGDQVSGLLTLLDCREGLSLTLENSEGIHLFHTDVPERVTFAGSAPDVGRELECGVQDPPPSVTITYRSAGEDSPFRGVPDRVEFLEN